ncbi:Fic family protein [Curtobacterium sp. MCPF17_002]|uniref:Fic family protein n=1 Tax=Curtobacterium sp. MCPF17_002 TaxID=2175645 RepID=UPI001C648910|nr:Fic family protein [Curtobacterium sp. MCPF17_002]WIB77618.1 Fic family protein [Curtobacterium sp. MCPF17_002]
MGSYETVRRPGDPGASSRPFRSPMVFNAYVPDVLMGRTFALDGIDGAAILDATTAVAAIEARSTVLGSGDALGRMLLRAEAVGSSMIEGLEVSPRRLLEEEARAPEGAAQWSTAREVLGNIHAMTFLSDSVDPGDEVTLEVLLEAHRRLMAASTTPEYGGEVRRAQNWIGGPTPTSAAFVPPVPERVPELLDDLVEFVNTSTLPAIAIAAIAHAQFETIHPFADGNGRIGRALIHAVLRSRGLTAQSAPPVSLVLATRAGEYEGALQRYRTTEEPGSETGRAAAGQFVRLFAEAMAEVVDRMDRFETELTTIRSGWREALVGVRSDSAAWSVLDVAPRMPVMTMHTFAAATGKSEQAANTALRVLVERGILVQRSIGRRNRVFEADAVIGALTLLERRLASPVGDTALVPPTRRVPALPPSLG